ncbi:class I SAM-dependent methyltransferase [Bradyrhizobium jicamae]|uniref:Class I SAM-dependent methyltransferase n=1 Tax=Bradyrhizobium jicamae TaxID=280332 RepID=A0ABS5FL96_9BRAD|nr:cyclopropane-fatty-acyl-phospholipid synthase family protein [Bradyrhizobium jicamae]MBR0797552.1 class I SAM-dependent methyltransferase [Bradyrhizobium jicamae]
MPSDRRQTVPGSLAVAWPPVLSATLGALLRPLLRRLDCGEIVVQAPGGRSIVIAGTRRGEHAQIRIHSWRCLLRFLTGGDLGFAEGYLAGEWSTPNLHAFLSAAAPRSTSATSFERLRPPQPLTWLRHAVLNRNTRRGSRRNIRAHYDLGNDFYRRWLDPSMTYSSAIYTSSSRTLEQAQRNKLERITELLDLGGGEKVLEIGCGWGALARHIITAAGAEVTGLTLSTEQLGYAREQIAECGLAGNADLRLEDYRDTVGNFDRVVSIEMLEAVGEAYWPLFFDNLQQRLKPGGIAVLQVITIERSRFENYRRRPEFIQRYIFPGGMLPTAQIVERQVANSGLQLVSSEYFGRSYARTLADWHERFLSAWPSIEAIGFDVRFKRMWEYYLSYCRLGFEIGALDVGLYKIERSA